MSKRINHLLFVIFFIFGLINISNLYRFDNIGYGLISLLIGTVSLLVSLGLLQYAFKKGYFDE